MDCILQERSVWYAVYGSNLKKERFMRYLDPQECDAGTKNQDQIKERRFRLQFKLYFAYECSSWGLGGVAFVETERVIPPPTFGRAYLLTLPQLRCVARGENGKKSDEGIDMVKIAQVISTGISGDIRVIKTTDCSVYLISHPMAPLIPT
jgi:hypothetical protein